MYNIDMNQGKSNIKVNQKIEINNWRVINEHDEIDIKKAGN